MTTTSVMNHDYNISQNIGNNICLILRITSLWFIHLPQMAITSAIHPYLWVKTFSHTLSGVTKLVGKTFSSDLRKLTAVRESLSKSKIIYSVIEEII